MAKFKIDTSHFIDSKNQMDVGSFISEAVFAHELLLNGEKEKARSSFPNAYLFAVDNIKIPNGDFTAMLSELQTT